MLRKSWGLMLFGVVLFFGCFSAWGQEPAGGKVPIEHMLKKTAKDFCAMCHADKAKFFNTGGHGKVNVTCQACHNPHGQGSNKMLRWDEKGFCLKCHGKVAEHFPTSGHGKVGVECQACHDPHGAGADASDVAAPASEPEKKPEEKKDEKKGKK